MLLADNDIEVAGPSTFALLRSLAKEAPNKRSRICFTRLTDGVQEMIICLLKGSYIRAHRHPKHKSESYHVIQGTLLVALFDDQGKEKEVITLNEGTPYYRMKNGIYHRPVPVSDYVIYHEVYEGPFNKEIDVQYALWSSPEKV